MAWKGTRPPAVTARDEQVHAYLKEHGPCSRNAIAEALGISRSLAYLSLDRLRKITGPDGKPAPKVKRCLTEESSYTMWTADVDKPCPS